ncbi:hypothetical protein [Lentzea sp. CC55]|uniref:hypothetical protein n=1 Tax=Lentzea sp. CC55 TaxID=2884909 RepID=UPI001F45A129|nr:hypothetical protein [Lentzea sp. CC55]MCG8925600.1 hypothetical protein [Lentzea sp. CC55]
MRRLLLVPLALLLAACGTSDSTVEKLADRIEADLNAEDGVSEVVVQHRADVDHQQRLTVTATVRDGGTADRALEVVKRDYWTGTGRTVDFRVRFADETGVELRKSDVRFKLGDVVEMERRYGPRSEAGELDPGR